MKLRIVREVIVFFSLVLFLSPAIAVQMAAQSPAQTASALPRLVRFSGMVKDLNGNPLTGVVGITFALYSEQSGDAALWLETQNAVADSNGHYTVLLGATKPEGLPADLFTSEQARWVGVQVSGQAERPRVLLVSAPYALKAGDAETIGGLPPSAFVLAAPQTGRAATESAVRARAASGPTPDIAGTGTADFIPLWTNSSTLGNSNIFQSPTLNIGIGTTSPGATLEVNGTAKVDGAATVAGNLTVNANINLPGTTATAGTINLGGVPFLSAPGSGISFNTSLGLDALSAKTTGGADTATGVFAMLHNTSGSNNTANGFAALELNSTGSDNTGVGYQALVDNTTGSFNVALGHSALSASTSGLANTGVGYQALIGNTTGSFNVALGHSALSASTAGFANTGIGNSAGNTADSSKLTGKNNTALGTGARFGTGSLTNSTAIGANAEVTESNAMVLGSIKGVNGQTVSINVGIGTTAPGFALDVRNFGSGGGAEGSNAAIHGAASGTSVTATEFFGPSGVWGDTGGPSESSFGVLGTADDNVAGLFSNESSPDGQPALEAINIGVNDFASPVFLATGGDGRCTINNNGDLSCTGTIKGVVPAAGGARRVSVYAMQSADNWFEDAGSGQLSNGSAVVALDPTFAQIVNAGVEYHVFLTPNGDCKGLYVTHKSAASFEVHELGGGASSITFDYRIMAKRMGYEKERLEDVTERYQKMEEQQRLRRGRMRLGRAARSAAGPKLPLEAAAQPAAQPAAAQPE